MKSKVRLHFLLFFIFNTSQIAIFAQNENFDCSNLKINAELIPTCKDFNNGQILLSIEKGMPPYQIHWDHGATSKKLKKLSAGNYRVTVTDALGCRGAATFSVTSLHPITALVQVGHTTKAGKSNGTIELEVSGGQPPYSYTWISRETGIIKELTENLESLNKLTAGHYKIMIFDAVGCYNQIETEVR